MEAGFKARPLVLKPMLFLLCPLQNLGDAAGHSREGSWLLLEEISNQGCEPEAPRQRGRSEDPNSSTPGLKDPLTQPVPLHSVLWCLVLTLAALCPSASSPALCVPSYLCLCPAVPGPGRPSRSPLPSRCLPRLPPQAPFGPIYPLHLCCACSPHHASPPRALDFHLRLESRLAANSWGRSASPFWRTRYYRVRAWPQH